MMGYMYNDKATKETIDPEGWLHSGDIGTGEEGYLKITGRKKEILLTAAGENVAPVLLEDEIKKQLPCVSNAMVIGDRKKYLTVFLCLKTKMNEEDGTPLDGLVSDSTLFGCITVQDAKRSSEQDPDLHPLLFFWIFCFENNKNQQPRPPAQPAQPASHPDLQKMMAGKNKTTKTSRKHIL